MLPNWQQQFADAEPVAYLLASTFSDRWVRLHSLPGSKRYPEDEAEYAILLNRHNRVLDTLTASDRRVVLLSTGYSDSPEPVRSYSDLSTFDPHARPWRSVPMHKIHGGFTDPTILHVFASNWEWHPGLFDPIVRLVANDVVANIMIVSPDCLWLMHPYDGGMDVIVESQAVRNRLKSPFSDWLSARPDGL